MTQQFFYVSRSGSHEGPYHKDILLEKINHAEYDWNDYIFDEVKNDWVLIMEHSVFTMAFNQSLQLNMETGTVYDLSQSALHKEKVWFILQDGHNYGPFCQLEIIQMLQEKALFEYDYIWHESFPTWKKIAEVAQFSVDEIKRLRNSLPPDLSDVFFRRRHPRVKYGCSLIVHNNKIVFRGSSIEISAGGAGIVVDGTPIENGQTLFLHFQDGDGVPSFNAVCTVVSRQTMPSLPSATKYGVRFTSISTQVREKINNYAHETLRAVA